MIKAKVHISFYLKQFSWQSYSAAVSDESFCCGISMYIEYVHTVCSAVCQQHLRCIPARCRNKIECLTAIGSLLFYYQWKYYLLVGVETVMSLACPSTSVNHKKAFIFWDLESLPWITKNYSAWIWLGPNILFKVNGNMEHSALSKCI